MRKTKRVLVLADLPGSAIEELGELFSVEVHEQGVADEAELARRVAGVHGLVTLLSQQVGEPVFRAGSELEAIANYAVGVDNIDLAAARRRGIWVCHTPDVLTAATADLTWGLILAVTRRLPEAERFLRAGRFAGWEPRLLLGRGLAGATLGVVGAGRIGRAVMARARGFEMGVIYSSRHALAASEESELATERCELDTLLATADVVTLHLPLDSGTRHLIDAGRLALMRRGSFLVNTSRGPVVDESALADALVAGHLGGAGLDVYEHEPAIEPRLLELPNVVLLPHIGSATFEARSRMADLCATSLRQALAEGRRPDLAL